MRLHIFQVPLAGVNTHTQFLTRLFAVTSRCPNVRPVWNHIQDIEILDFPTKDIPWRSDVVNAIDICIAAYDPDIIFTHHPFDTHQAHSGVSNATIAAARRRNTVFFYEPISPSGRSYVAFRPQLYVDITQTIDKKVASLREHKSEYNKFGGEDWVEGVHARCGFRGYEIGKKYAEAFEVLRIEMGFEANNILA